MLQQYYIYIRLITFNKTRNLSESVEVNSNKAGSGHAPNCQAVIVQEQIDMGKAGRIVSEWEGRL